MRNRLLFKSYEWAASAFDNFCDTLRKEKRVNEEGLRRIENEKRDAQIKLLHDRRIRLKEKEKLMRELKNKLKEHEHKKLALPLNLTLKTIQSISGKVKTAQDFVSRKITGFI